MLTDQYNHIYYMFLINIIKHRMNYKIAYILIYNNVKILKTQFSINI